MLEESKIAELLDCVDVNDIRVHAPTSLLFLCGGQIRITENPAPSLRDAFARFAMEPPFSKYNVLIAEDLNAFFPSGVYRDLLLFESDIAQISELILVFSESYGSAAELGAFCMVAEISQRLLVVIDSKNYSENSFVTLGPLRFLQNEHGDEAVCVLNLKDMNLHSISDVSSLNVNSFRKSMEGAIKSRKSIPREKTSFDKSRPGHIIKLIVGIIQHYGALTLEEVSVHISVVRNDLDDEIIKNYLLCAEFAGWVRKEKRGVSTFYVSLTNKPAFNYSFRPGVAPMDKTRWQLDIREYWKKNDPDRFSVIADAIGGI